jgi:hypothetical protein
VLVVNLNPTNSGHTQDSLHGWSVLCLFAGLGFLALSLLGWLATRDVALLLIGSAMLFGGVANSLAFLVLQRMQSAGYRIGFWRIPSDVTLYREYWRIAPGRGWSRLPVVGLSVSFIIAACLLLCIPYSGSVFWKGRP